MFVVYWNEVVSNLMQLTTQYIISDMCSKFIGNPEHAIMLSQTVGVTLQKLRMCTGRFIELSRDSDLFQVLHKTID